MAFVCRWQPAFFSLLCLFSFHASADDYLKMLESEAAGLKLDQSGQIEKTQQAETPDKEVISKTQWDWEGKLEGDKLPTGMTEDSFSALLKQHFYGTFVFYRKLNSNDKKTVFYHYSQSREPDLDAVRKDILGLLKQ